MHQLRHSHWSARLTYFVVFFLFEVITAAFLIPALLSFFDSAFPGLLFYHLGPDETPGPLGSIDLLLCMLGFVIVFTFLSIVPAGFYLRISWTIIVIAAALNFFAVSWAVLHVGPALHNS